MGVHLSSQTPFPPKKIVGSSVMHLTQALFFFFCKEIKLKTPRDLLLMIHLSIRPKIIFNHDDKLTVIFYRVKKRECLKTPRAVTVRSARVLAGILGDLSTLSGY